MTTKLQVHSDNEAIYKPLKWIAILNILAGLDTAGFWIGFFTEILFPIDELKILIHNFEGYYAWESCFVVPDSLLILTAIYAGITVLKDQSSSLGRMLLAASAGAWIFLGVLDFTYGINNGMYTLGHWFSYILLSIGLCLPLIGIVTLWVLHKSNKEVLRSTGSHT